MKIDLIGMILNNCKKGAFHGALLKEDGTEMSEVESLDTMIMEYAKVKNGEESSCVAVSNLVKK